MAEMNSTEKKNALIGQIAALMLSDPELASNPWDSLSLVANYANGQDVSGYRYYGDDYEGWLPDDSDVDKKIKLLQSLMEEDENRKWKLALIYIEKASMSIDIQFEYDDATRWMPSVKSLDMSEFAFSLRPSAD